MFKPKSGLITASSAVGGRDYQEDRFLIEYCAEGTLLAVMDGHIGAGTAQFVADNFRRYFMGGWKRHRDSGKALRHALRHLEMRTRGMEAGTTLSATFIFDDRPEVLVAVVGDSPVLILADHGLFIGPDHNVRTNLEERKRCIERGGEYSSNGYILSNITRDWGLQMSRSFGDRAMGGVIERVPEFYSVQRAEAGYVALMTDGVVDPGHSGSGGITEVTRILNEGACAMDLVRRVTSAVDGADDNATAIVWRPV